MDPKDPIDPKDPSGPKDPTSQSGTPPSSPTAAGGPSLPSPPQDWKDRFKKALVEARDKTGVILHQAQKKAGPLAGRVQERVFRLIKDNPWASRLHERALAQLRSRMQGMEAAGFADFLSKSFQKQGAGFYGKLLTWVLCSYFLADLTALFVAKFIPEPPSSRPVRTDTASMRLTKPLEEYEVIFKRNLFNSRGIIPGEETPAQGNVDQGGVPVKTSLPFNLIGTLILRDEIRSIGTIEDKSAGMVYPVRVDDEIPTKAKIIRVEPDRVIFVNLSSGKREFVELPEELRTDNPRLNLGVTSAKGGGAGIEKLSSTQFNINRGEVDKALSDLNNILTQARAVPNFENGLPSGYKLFQIVPGSIYDKLGLVNGDVIAGLNGQPINDPGKAFEMLNELKTTSHLELQIKRDGKTSTFSYDIH